MGGMNVHKEMKMVKAQEPLKLLTKKESSDIFISSWTFMLLLAACLWMYSLLPVHHYSPLFAICQRFQTIMYQEHRLQEAHLVWSCDAVQNLQANEDVACFCEQM